MMGWAGAQDMIGACRVSYDGGPLPITGHPARSPKCRRFFTFPDPRFLSECPLPDAQSPSAVAVFCYKHICKESFSDPHPAAGFPDLEDALIPRAFSPCLLSAGRRIRPPYLASGQSPPAAARLSVVYTGVAREGVDLAHKGPGLLRQGEGGLDLVRYIIIDHAKHVVEGFRERHPEGAPKGQASPEVPFP
jgi:hypothetical protein